MNDRDPDVFYGRVKPMGSVPKIDQWLVDDLNARIRERVAAFDREVRDEWIDKATQYAVEWLRRQKDAQQN